MACRHSQQGQATERRGTGPHTGTQADWNAENPRLLGGFAEAADGCRTRDLELGKLALYQLSYRRMMQGNPAKPLFLLPVVAPWAR